MQVVDANHDVAWSLIRVEDERIARIERQPECHESGEGHREEGGHCEQRAPREIDRHRQEFKIARP